MTELTELTELTESIKRLNEFYQKINNVNLDTTWMYDLTELKVAVEEEKKKNIKKISKEELNKTIDELQKVLNLFASEKKTQEVTDGIAEVTKKNEDNAAKLAAQNKEPSILESLGFKLFSKKPVEPAKKELSIIAQFYDSIINFKKLLEDLNKEIQAREKTGIKAEEVEKTGIKAEEVEKGTGTGGRRKPRKSKRNNKSKRTRK